MPRVDLLLQKMVMYSVAGSSAEQDATQGDLAVNRRVLDVASYGFFGGGAGVLLPLFVGVYPSLRIRSSSEFGVCFVGWLTFLAGV